MSAIILSLLGDMGEISLSALDGKTFQVHVLSGHRLKLYPVEIAPVDTRCPVIIGGERCGMTAGHLGKHCWSNGD